MTYILRLLEAGQPTTLARGDIVRLEEPDRVEVWRGGLRLSFHEKTPPPGDWPDSAKAREARLCAVAHLLARLGHLDGELRRLEGPQPAFEVTG